MKQQKYFFPPFFFYVFIIFLLTSCSLKQDLLKSNKDIVDYAEFVFKRQNLVTQRLMMLYDVEIPHLVADKIYLSELHMHDACHLLNEYTNREIEGRTMTVFFRRQVKNSLGNCDESAAKMELILLDID